MLQTSHHAPVPEKRNRPILKWIVWICVALILLFILGTGGIAYYVGSKLVHPARKPITATPAQVGLQYQSISFPSAVDHVQLSGWYIPAAKATDKVIIEAHGYRQNRSADKPSLPMAKAFHNAGYAVIMFDFRDEGKSAGHMVSVGLYEQRDLNGAVAFAKTKGFQHIGLIGYSMGASTSLEVAAANPSVSATVADSPFANLYQYLHVNMPTWTHLPNWPFTSEIFLEMRMFDGVNVHNVNPLQDLTHFGKRPLLLIAGTADTTIPMRNSQELAQELHNDPNTKLWLVQGAKHVGAYTVQPTTYRQKVLAFFQQYM